MDTIYLSDANEAFFTNIHDYKDTYTVDTSKPFWYEIDGEKYYFKAINNIYFFINELIGSKIATLFNLPTIKYSLARDNNMYGLLSKSWIKDNYQYITADNLSYKDKKHIISNLKKQANDTLTIDLYKLMLLDYYTSQIDRVPVNMVFAKNNKELILNDTFDFSATFNVMTSSKYYPLFSNNPGYYRYYYPVDSNPYICSNYLYSLAFPSKETIDIYNSHDLKEMVDIIDDFNLTKEINTIEDMIDIKIPNSLMNHYSNQDEIKKKQLTKIKR